MGNEVDRVVPDIAPKKASEPELEESPKDQELDRIANDAAQRAGKTENRYDQGHNIFTK